MTADYFKEAIRRWRQAGLLVVLAAAILSAAMGGALAHASLVGVEPADGSVVATAPRAFAVTFNEPTSPLVLKLVRPDGSSVSLLRRFQLHDATLDIEAPDDLGDGTYVLSWRVISEDGHPVGGSAVFSIGAPSAGGGHVPAEAVDWPLRTGVWLMKVALYAGLFAGVGGVFFLAWIGGRSRPVEVILSSALIAGLVAAAVSVGLQGLDALGLSYADLMHGAVWTTGLSTSYGATALIAAAALILALLSMRLSPTAAKAAALVALAGVGLALAASGHASAAQPQWLTRPAVFLHGLGVAFWIGSLAPLGAALATSDGRAVLLRFSRAIPFAVVPLALAGLMLAAIQLRSVEALWTTAYGQVLLVKLTLLAVLFLLAAINRLRLTTPAAASDARAVLRLHRSIRLEIALALAVLAVAAVWRFTPPPRAMIEAAAAPAFVHIHSDKAMAEVTITPGHAGPVTASVVLMTGDFGPLEAKEVTLVLSNPAAGVEQIRRPALKSADGAWRVEGLNLPLAGAWTVRVDILISDFELVKLQDRIDIRP